MSEFVEVEWFGRQDKIGIVLTYDEYDGFKCRMAPMPKVKIYSPDKTVPWEEEDDIKWLMQNAAKIPFEWAWGIFGKRMKGEWLRRHLHEDNHDTVRYDRRDYNVKTLEEVK